MPTLFTLTTPLHSSYIAPSTSSTARLSRCNYLYSNQCPSPLLSETTYLTIKVPKDILDLECVAASKEDGPPSPRRRLVFTETSPNSKSVNGHVRMEQPIKTGSKREF